MAAPAMERSTGARRLDSTQAGSNRRAWSHLKWIPLGLLLVPWLISPLVPSQQGRVRAVAAPVSFTLLDWETANAGSRVGDLWAALTGDAMQRPSDLDLVRAYLSSPVAERQDTRNEGERALERLISSALTELGVTPAEPMLGARVFPPVLLALTSPPQVLVTSPRDQLRITQSVVVDGSVSEAKVQQIEASADSTGVSSLVAPIGGIATYPAIVPLADPATRLLASAAHEWTHHYLFFSPLGAEYFSSQQAREINETVADMVGQEVATRLAPELGFPPPATQQSQGSPDVRKFLQTTRAEVEHLLAAGEVEQAEAYMRDRRDELERQGTRIRKLNQAYFALYGSYTEGFAAAPSNPLPSLLRTLREQSGSLGEFLRRVRNLTDVADVRHAVNVAS